MIRYVLYRLAIAVLPKVPERVGYRISGWFADFAAIAARHDRSIIEGNLRVVLGADVPPARLRETVRLAFRNLIWNYFELFQLPGVRLDELRDRGDINSVERALRQATNDGSVGAIIAFAHVGSIEVFSRVALMLPGLRFAVVAEHMTDERMFQLLRDLRRGQGLELVQADEPRRIIELLHQGCSLIIAGDLDTTHHGVHVDFFGLPARMPTGAVKLALRTRAPLMVAHTWRTRMEEPERFQARILGPIPLSGSANRKADIINGVSTLVGVLEEGIAAHPEQWLAFHNVWKE